MNMKQIAAALALSLTVATSQLQAAEVSADLGAHVQQVIAEIHGGNADWNHMVGRIDRLVAHIDEQILDGTGDHDQLQASRRRLVNARTKIAQQYLTATPYGGEVAIGPAPAAVCEVCGVSHSAPVAAPPAGLDYGVGGSPVDGGYGGYSSGTSGGFSGGGGGGGGGGGIGGLGGIAILGGIAAAIATTFDDDEVDLIIVSPSN